MRDNGTWRLLPWSTRKPGGSGPGWGQWRRNADWAARARAISDRLRVPCVSTEPG